MNIISNERGFYFRVFKQDVLKKDLWLEDVLVFARNANCAAELYAEIHCQEKDYVYSIKGKSMDEYDFIIRGEFHYERKYKMKIHRELDIEIPAYLRN